MRSILNSIFEKGFEGVLANPMPLLSLYSKLYISGGQPNWCEKCLADYFNELKNSGMTRIELLEKIEQRTLIPNWVGLRFIDGQHIGNDTIIDEVAIKYLKIGLLKESDFLKLPDGYNVYIVKSNVKIKKANK